MPQSESSVVVDEGLPSSPQAFAPDASLVVRAAPLLAMLVVAVWAGFRPGTSSGQWGDHFEQFVWAHGLQWGYHKHPPLPTWLLGGADSRHRARRLVGRAAGGRLHPGHRVLHLSHRADAARQRRQRRWPLLLWGLQHAFSARAVLFNHNTVLMLMISITAWALLQPCATSAARRSGGWPTGAAAGLSLLAKYQALVPLPACSSRCFLSGDAGDPPGAARPAARRRHRLAGRDAAPALGARRPLHGDRLCGAARPVDELVRAGAMNVASFLAQQLRMLFPALLLCGALLLLPGARGVESALGDREQARRVPGSSACRPAPCADRSHRAAFRMLLQNHWGYQATQFVGLWLAWRLRPRVVGRRTVLDRRRAPGSRAFMAGAVSPAPAVNGNRHDRHYPAQALADAVRKPGGPTPLSARHRGRPDLRGRHRLGLQRRARHRCSRMATSRIRPGSRRADLERNGAVYVVERSAAPPFEGCHQHRLLRCAPPLGRCREPRLLGDRSAAHLLA